MKRHWNWLLYAGFLVTLFAFLSYFTFFVRFPITRDVPWVNFLLFVVGLGLVAGGVARAFRQPGEYRGRISGPILGLLSLLICGFFLFSTLWLSKQLPASKGAPVVGERAPDFTLPDSNGTPVSLAKILAGSEASRGQWVLLVFYRGYW